MPPTHHRSPGARVALICSAHGFGHLTRQLALGEALQKQGAKVSIFTAAPPSVVRETLDFDIHPIAVDVGIAQRDSVTEDLDATLSLLDQRCSEAAIDRLAANLADFDRIVVDIAPPALEAARRAGRPTLAIGSFDWAWVYRHYPPLHTWAARFAQWQAPHIGLEIQPGPGLTGFHAVERFGLLGRRRPAVRVAERAVLVSFGGFGLAEVDRLLPRIPGVTWICSPPMPALDREDCRYVRDVPYPALVAGADAVLTKPGYSILVEASLAGTPLVWIGRPGWPESPALEAAMRARGDVKVEHVEADAVAEALFSRWAIGRPEPVEGDEVRLAARVLA